MFPSVPLVDDWHDLAFGDESVPFDADYERWVLSGYEPANPLLPSARLERTWYRFAADGMMWSHLQSVAPGTMFDRVERVEAWSRLVNAATGALYAELAALHAAHLADRDYPAMLPHDVLDSTAAMVGCAMRVTSRAAKDKVQEAIALRRYLPRVTGALESGEVSPAVAHAVLEETTCLDEDDLPGVEDALFPGLADMTPGEARAAAKKAALSADPKTAAKREKKARTGRRVDHTPARDGMGWLSALLPAETSSAIFEVIDAHAKACPGDGRDIGARRADALADLILNPEANRPQVHVHLHVVATAGSLLGLSGEPAMLAGYGPITPALARELAADATWSRILTDPAGEVLEIGTKRYTPSEKLARKVRTRDQHCRFPGCRRPVWGADLDHTVPYPKGPTTEGNLSGLCRFHHRIKHMPGWSKTQAPGGALTWCDPSGHTYITRPPKMPGHDGKKTPTDDDVPPF